MTLPLLWAAALLCLLLSPLLPRSPRRPLLVSLPPMPTSDPFPAHLRKIDLAHRVHVLNVGGYVGDSTRREVLYSRHAGKLVTWFDEFAVPADLAEGGRASPAHDPDELWERNDELCPGFVKGGAA